MTELAKAELRQLDAKFEHEIERGNWCTVQFNPESLKVSFANQLVQPSGAGDQTGPPARQFVGAGTTKLALTLWFDVTSLPPEETVDDVRKLTKKVAFFITPKEEGTGSKKKYVPPAVRFIWGTFQFDGLMDSLEETLEFFSIDGKPLRASLAVALSQQKIQFVVLEKGGTPRPQGAAGAGGAPSDSATTPGTEPLTQAPAGSTVQGLAAASGQGDNWQGIAAANGIENPRLLEPGQLIDLGASIDVGVSGGIGVSSGIGASAGVGVEAGASVGIGG